MTALPQEDAPEPTGHLVEKWRQHRMRVVHEAPARLTQRQHGAGKLTVRERIEHFLDPGSFLEFDLYRRSLPGSEEAGHYTDGVVTGTGTVDGRQVFLYAQDFRIAGGSLGRVHADKILKVMDLAESSGCPLISLNDGAGARIQEGVGALAGYGEIFRRNVRASGVIPQISVILGPCAGGAAYSPALTDFVFMVRDTSYMFLTGPDVVQEVTGEDVTQNDLGGAHMHATTSGVATFIYDDERECLDEVRYLLSLLPSNSRQQPPVYDSADPVTRSCERLADIVPSAPNRPYDMRDVIAEVLDDDGYLEVQSTWADNVVCVLGRIGGRTVGVVANQPLARAGVLDIAACEKASRFVRTCDAFNIPLVTLVDVPGFMPGVEQEHRGIIRHGAKLLYAYCDASVPRVQVILRKAYGGAYIVMDSRSIGCDMSFAWPTNEIAVMGARSAVTVINRKELADATDADRLRRKLISEYEAQMMHPYYAAERGLVDDVIDPASTRATIAQALAVLTEKRSTSAERKHGNPPT